jgi:hypothetical protein
MNLTILLSLIALFLGLGLFFILKATRQQSGKYQIQIMNLNQSKLSVRLFYYFVLGLFSMTIPYLLAMTIAIASGNRESGIGLSVFPGIAMVQLIFGLFFIKKKIFLKILLLLALTLIIFVLVFFTGVEFQIIKTGWDLYGFWDLALTNFLCGVLVWELYFQIDKKLTL